MSKKIIKYPVMLNNKYYTIIIKEKCDDVMMLGWDHWYYKVYLYKGKYKIFNHREYIAYFDKEIYKYDLISMVNEFIIKYNAYINNIEKQNEAIKDLKKWDGVINQ